MTETPSSEAVVPGHGHPSMVIAEKTKEILSLKYGYQIGQTIAQGSFSVVFEASNKSITNPPSLAVKVINTSMLTAEEREIDLPKELRALRKVKHRYIIRVMDIFRHRGHVYIFMERAEGGDLATYRFTHFPLAERLVSAWFLQLMEAISYLHQIMAIAHRDVKLGNLLLDVRHNLKLCDFGFSFFGDRKLGSPDEQPRSTDILGTRPCMCPQLLEGVSYNPYKADIFAIGASLFLMLAEGYPYDRTIKDNSVLLEQQTRNYPQFLRSRFPESMSTEAKDLIEQMLQPDEEKRPNAIDLLKHPFFTLKKI